MGCFNFNRHFLPPLPLLRKILLPRPDFVEDGAEEVSVITVIIVNCRYPRNRHFHNGTSQSFRQSIMPHLKMARFNLAILRCFYNRLSGST